MVKVLISIEADLHDAIKIQAKHLDRSVNSLIRLTLKQSFEAEKVYTPKITTIQGSKIHEVMPSIKKINKSLKPIVKAAQKSGLTAADLQNMVNSHKTKK